LCVFLQLRGPRTPPRRGEAGFCALLAPENYTQADPGSPRTPPGSPRKLYYSHFRGSNIEGPGVGLEIGLLGFQNRPVSGPEIVDFCGLDGPKQAQNPFPVFQGNFGRSRPPGPPLDRRGPPRTSIPTKNQPRRPSLRLNGGERKVPPAPRKTKMVTKRA